MYEIGQTFTEEPSADVFAWCEANDAHIWEVLDGDATVWRIFENYHPEIEEAKKQRQAEMLDKLEPLFSQTTIQSDKVGQLWQITKLGEIELMREYVPDPNYNPTDEDGSYLKPFTYSAGMSVTTGLWYTDGSDIWEAIKSGTPAGFDDQEYFDIITM